MIILMGVAGAGKSMQGRMLADERGYAWISTGELLRVLVTGRRRQEMLQGKLLSDEEMVNIIDKIFDLIDTSQEFVLDGFPRTIPQTKWLLGQADRGRFNVDAIIDLDASRDIVKARLQARGRIDDNEEAIRLRFDEYERVTRPIIALFQEKQIPVYRVDGGKTPEAVHEAILKHVSSISPSDGSLMSRLTSTD